MREKAKIDKLASVSEKYPIGQVYKTSLGTTFTIVGPDMGGIKIQGAITGVVSVKTLDTWIFTGKIKPV